MTILVLKKVVKLGIVTSRNRKRHVLEHGWIRSCILRFLVDIEKRAFVLIQICKNSVLTVNSR